MKTKAVWVYVVMDGNGGSPLAFASNMTARSEHKKDRDYGYTVSPIVRVDVPLPARDASPLPGGRDGGRG